MQPTVEDPVLTSPNDYDYGRDIVAVCEIYSYSTCFDDMFVKTPDKTSRVYLHLSKEIDVHKAKIAQKDRMNCIRVKLTL